MALNPAQLSPINNISSRLDVHNDRNKYQHPRILLTEYAQFGFGYEISGFFVVGWLVGWLVGRCVFFSSVVANVISSIDLVCQKTHALDKITSSFVCFYLVMRLCF